MTEPAPYDSARAVTATAEAMRSVAEQAGGLGRYIAQVLGSTPHNLVAVFNDRIAASRMRRAIDLYAGVKQKLEAAGLRIEDLKFPSASIEVPLLEAATMEDREGLADLWEKLLAAAIAPGSRDRVRARHIEILRTLEPLDAWLLQNIDSLNSQARSQRQEREKITQIHFAGPVDAHEIADEVRKSVKHVSDDDVITALEALRDIGLFYLDTLGGWNETALGRSFLSVVNSVQPA